MPPEYRPYTDFAPRQLKAGYYPTPDQFHITNCLPLVLSHPRSIRIQGRHYFLIPTDGDLISSTASHIISDNGFDRSYMDFYSTVTPTSIQQTFEDIPNVEYHNLPYVILIFHSAHLTASSSTINVLQQLKVIKTADTLGRLYRLIHSDIELINSDPTSSFSSGATSQLFSSFNPTRVNDTYNTFPCSTTVPNDTADWTVNALSGSSSEDVDQQTRSSVTNDPITTISDAHHLERDLTGIPSLTRIAATNIDDAQTIQRTQTPPLTVDYQHLGRGKIKRCPVPGCPRTKPFKRRDNLVTHIRSVHGVIIPKRNSIFRGSRRMGSSG